MAIAMGDTKKNNFVCAVNQKNRNRNRSEMKNSKTWRQRKQRKSTSKIDRQIDNQPKDQENAKKKSNKKSISFHSKTAQLHFIHSIRSSSLVCQENHLPNSMNKMCKKILNFIYAISLVSLRISFGPSRLLLHDSNQYYKFCVVFHHRRLVVDDAQMLFCTHQEWVISNQATTEDALVTISLSAKW